MKVSTPAIYWVFFYSLLFGQSVFAQPIDQHPDNPHYFLYQGTPLVLVTSAEHYGAVIHQGFDYEKYLHTLARLGLNHSRIFLGDYFEYPGAFGIMTNTLAPDSNQLIAPWQRSNEPGFKLGGNKFDLDRWNPAYFERLGDFMQQAAEQGVVVEVVLFFSCFIDDTSPFYGPNNINDLPAFSSLEYRTLANEQLLQRQRAYCEKLVEFLNPYDNLIINIANEPWFSNQIETAFASPPKIPTLEWIQEVSSWIVALEANLPKQHLLSVDFTNEGVEIPLDWDATYFQHLSIYNHHYDADAESVIKNYDRIPKIFSFNETGVMATSTPEYRFQAWKYLMNGGALYNNLDFTYQVGDEDGHGTSLFSGGQSGYMGCTDHDVKYQLARLLEFWQGLNFVDMIPGDNCISFEYGHLETYGFYEAGETYLVYFIGSGQPGAYLNMVDGKYRLEWLDPRTLQVLEEEEVMVENSFLNLAGPGFREDIVALLRRVED
ncbi:MAG: hypothetical protein AAF433_06975 [Bacteroidota bacterium]